MYRRYYDGYGAPESSNSAVDSIEQPIREKSENTDETETNRYENTESETQIQNLPASSSESVSNVSYFAPLGLGNLEIDDIILIGVIILLLTESETPDTPLLLIVAFIFIAGFID